MRTLKFCIELDTYTTYPPISACVLKQKYLENHLSMRDIASEFSRSKSRIRSLLLRYGIPLREPNKYHKDHWCIYGKRRVKGKDVDHQRELRTITAIKRMYAEGMSTAAIARTLSTMQVLTKRLERESDKQAAMSRANGKGWDHSTVTAILKRTGVYTERGQD